MRRAARPEPQARGARGALGAQEHPCRLHGPRRTGGRGEDPGPPILPSDLSGAGQLRWGAAPSAQGDRAAVDVDLRGAGPGGEGPSLTLPSVMSKVLPWHMQLMVPPETSPTTQPEWVQIAENALKSPSCGWVTTTFSALKILPPPLGMSEVLASTLPPPPVAPPSLPPAAPSSAPPSSRGCRPDSAPSALEPPADPGVRRTAAAGRERGGQPGRADRRDDGAPCRATPAPCPAPTRVTGDVALGASAAAADSWAGSRSALSPLSRL